MSHLNKILTLAALLSMLSFLSAGCTDDSVTADSYESETTELQDAASEVSVPDGPGVLIDDKLISIGSTKGELEQQFPGRVLVRDMGGSGVFFAIKGSGVSGLLAGDGADAEVTVLFPLPAENVILSAVDSEVRGLGDSSPPSTAEAVKTAFGDPVSDLFLGAWWYPDVGVMYHWRSDGSAWVQLFKAGGSW